MTSSYNDGTKMFSRFLFGKEDLSKQEKEKITRNQSHKKALTLFSNRPKVKGDDLNAQRDYLMKLKRQMKKADIIDECQSPATKLKQQLKEEGTLSSDFSQEDFFKEQESSESEGDPRYDWEDMQKYKNLPANVKNAIRLSREKQGKRGHSEFYYKLTSLNEKI